MTCRLGTKADIAELKKLDAQSAEVDAIDGEEHLVLGNDLMIDYFLRCRGLIVAETTGRLSGYALTHRVEWMHGVESMAWIEHVGVHPSHRRQGVGTAMLRFAGNHYKGRVSHLYAEIHPKNEKSLGLFRKAKAEFAERVLVFMEC